MNAVKYLSNDTAIINGATVTVDGVATLSSDAPIERIPALGLTDLPETDERIRDLWGSAAATARP